MPKQRAALENNIKEIEKDLRKQQLKSVLLSPKTKIIKSGAMATSKNYSVGRAPFKLPKNAEEIKIRN